MKISLLILSHFLVIEMFSQTFTGKLIYKVTIEDSINLKEKLRLYPILEEVSFSKTCTVWIKNDSLKFLTTADNGKPNSSGIQDGSHTYLIDSSNKKSPVDRKLIAKGLVLVGKGKSQHNILGFNCKEYNYANPIQEMTEKVWVSEQLKFKEQSNIGGFFPNYFYPEGLVFRIQGYYQGVLQTTWELVKIEICDVANDVFDVCEVQKKR